MQKQTKLLITTMIMFIFSIKPTNALIDQVLVVEDQESNEVNIQAGEKIEQSFVSPTDSFGIVTVNFILPKRDSKIKVNFKIKEKGQDNWIFEGTSAVHSLDFYHDNGIPFPFGFPTIENTEGKEYLFQVEPEEEITVLKTNGNLNFSVAKEAPAKKLILNDLSKNLKQDKIFFMLWGALIISFSFVLLRY
jgi:hypothetical protein